MRIFAIGVGLLGALFALYAFVGADASDATASRTRVVLLGTGTPTADPRRSGPCVAVIVDDVPYLVDAGPGLVRRATAAVEAGDYALHPSRLGHVFLSHLHSDHTVGLPDLWLSPWVLGRAAPLVVRGPTGTEDMAKHLTKAWRADIAIRTGGAEGLPPEGGQLLATDIQPGVVHTDERVTVTAIKVPHGSWPAAFAYRFETPDGVVVVSGDTAPSEGIIAACDGCALLVHEVYSKAGYDAVGDDGFHRYHGTFHTSTAQLAEVATRARPQKLVLYHQLYMGRPEGSLADEVRAGWSGEVVSGDDLDVFVLPATQAR